MVHCRVSGRLGLGPETAVTDRHMGLGAALLHITRAGFTSYLPVGVSTWYAPKKRQSIYAHEGLKSNTCLLNRLQVLEDGASCGHLSISGDAFTMCILYSHVGQNSSYIIDKGAQSEHSPFAASSPA